MITPGSADLVQHRLERVAIENHDAQREIRGHEGPHQRAKGQSGQDKLCPCRWFGDGHPARPTFIGTDHGHDHLNNGYTEGEDEGEVSELCNHGAIIGGV